MRTTRQILTKNLDKYTFRRLCAAAITRRAGLALILLLGLVWTSLLTSPISQRDADRAKLSSDSDPYSAWANEIYEREDFSSLKSAGHPAVNPTDQILMITTAGDHGAGSLTDAVTQANANPGRNIRIEVDEALFGDTTRKSIAAAKIVVGPRTGSLLIVGDQRDSKNGACVPLVKNAFNQVLELMRPSRLHFDNQFTCALAGRRWESNVHFITSISPHSNDKNGYAAFEILQGGNLTLRNLSLSTALNLSATTLFNKGSLTLENVAMTVSGNSSCVLNLGQMHWNATSCSTHDTSLGLETSGERDRVVSSKINNSLFVNHGTMASLSTTGFRYAQKTELESTLLVTTNQGTAFLDAAGGDAADVVSPVTLRNTTIAGCDGACRSRFR